ncbi:calcium-binding protein [Neogemmobacter tilapiae]|uniref:Calcium-binding protein n=1 Tax=Neogemmobacter tilapiae TaxID=875041 RepID=A0A918TT98_9RHOB|nr:calcium-binding protein [Gemmobacter tilapiae]GHC62548.1 hypothetical protein GCM10007315_28300 [Gemmobacter tilapiae]
MVERILDPSGSMDADLRDPGDGSGLDNDLVWVVSYAGIAPALHNIYTGAGTDVIDTYDANANNGHLIHAGSGNDTVYGGRAADSALDSSGNDFYDLGDGNDSAYVGKGNDVYRGGAGTYDSVVFLYTYADNGNYTLATNGVTFDLAKTGAQNLGALGRDQFSGFENVAGTHSADRLFGSGAANQLDGYDGNDLLAGRGGSDLITGGQGQDRLIGGAGADSIMLFESLRARDTIVYSSLSDSGPGVSYSRLDRIQDFDARNIAAGDKIDLRALDAVAGTAANEAFQYRGSGEFGSAQGEVRVRFLNGAYLVEVDTDGDVAAEMAFRVYVALGSLDRQDFLL